MILYMKVGSVTNAQRGAAALKRQGYKPVIKRLENPTKTDGCGYVIVVKAQDDEPVNIVEKSGVRVRSVDRE